MAKQAIQGRLGRLAAFQGPSAAKVLATPVMVRPTGAIMCLRSQRSVPAALVDMELHGAGTDPAWMLPVPRICEPTGSTEEPHSIMVVYQLPGPPFRHI